VVVWIFIKNIVEPLVIIVRNRLSLFCIGAVFGSTIGGSKVPWKPHGSIYNRNIVNPALSARDHFVQRVHRSEKH
jgi:hypothetical protein